MQYDTAATKEDFIDIAAAALGKRGGLKTSEIYGPEHYRKIQALGVKTKLAKRKLASK